MEPLATSPYFQVPLLLGGAKRRAPRTLVETISDRLDGVQAALLQKNANGYVPPANVERVISESIPQLKGDVQAVVEDAMHIQSVQVAKRRRVETTGDVIFIVEGQRIPAKTAFLKNASEELCHCIASKNERDEIRLKECSAEVVRQAIKWVERDKITITKETCVGLLVFSEKFLPELHSVVYNYIFNNLVQEEFPFFLSQLRKFPASAVRLHYENLWVFCHDFWNSMPATFEDVLFAVKNYSLKREVHVLDFVLYQVSALNLSDEQITELLKHIRFSLCPFDVLLEYASRKVGDRMLAEYVPDYIHYLAQAADSKKQKAHKNRSNLKTPNITITKRRADKFCWEYLSFRNICNKNTIIAYKFCVKNDRLECSLKTNRKVTVELFSGSPQVQRIQFEGNKLLSFDIPTEFTNLISIVEDDAPEQV